MESGMRRAATKPLSHRRNSSAHAWPAWAQVVTSKQTQVRSLTGHRIVAPRRLPCFYQTNPRLYQTLGMKSRQLMQA